MAPEDEDRSLISDRADRLRQVGGLVLVLVPVWLLLTALVTQVEPLDEAVLPGTSQGGCVGFLRHGVSVAAVLAGAILVTAPLAVLVRWVGDRLAGPEQVPVELDASLVEDADWRVSVRRSRGAGEGSERPAAPAGARPSADAAALERSPGAAVPPPSDDAGTVPVPEEPPASSAPPGEVPDPSTAPPPPPPRRPTSPVEGAQPDEPSDDDEGDDLDDLFV